MATKKISELSTYTESSISDATQALVPLDDLTVVGTGKTKHMSFAEQAKWFGGNLPKLNVSTGATGLVASAPFTLSQIWNNNAISFRGVKIAVTDTASAATSLPLEVLGGAGGVTNLLSVNKSGLSSTVALAAGNGTSAEPSYGFTNAAGVGFKRDAGGNGAIFCASSAEIWRSAASAIIMRSNGQFCWLPGSDFSAGADLFLERAAANHLTLRNGANPQAFSVHGTYTSPSVYNRLRLAMNGGTGRYEIASEHVGDSTIDIDIMSGGNVCAKTLGSLGYLWVPKSLVIGQLGVFDGLIQWHGKGYIAQPADGVFTIGDSASTSVGRLQWGGVTNAFPAIARNGTGLQIKLADNSALTGLEASVLTASLYVAAPDIWANSNSGRLAIGSSVDLTLYREAANHLALRNSTNAQSFSVYGSYTSGSVYNRLRTYYDGTNYNIAAEHVGSSYGSIQFLTNGALSLQVGNTGTVYVPNTLLLQTYIQWNGKGAIEQPTDGIFVFGNSSSIGGVLQLTENTAPSAPSANKVRIYAEDNGAGKTRLMAIFPSGAAQQIAIEP